jgi:hypothetical protein
MTFQNAIQHFQQLRSAATEKSEIKVYQDFITIFSNLEKKELPFEVVHCVK